MNHGRISLTVLSAKVSFDEISQFSMFSKPQQSGTGMQDTQHYLAHATKQKIKALLGMLARFPWGKGDMLGSMNGRHEGVSAKHASLIVSFHWIKVLITA